MCWGNVCMYRHMCPKCTMYICTKKIMHSYVYCIREFETLGEQHKCTGMQMQVGRHVHTRTCTYVLLHSIWKLSTLLGDQCPVSGQTKTPQSQLHLQEYTFTNKLESPTAFDVTADQARHVHECSCGLLFIWITSLHQMKNKTMPTSQVSLQDRMSRETQLPLGQEPHKKPAEI